MNVERKQAHMCRNPLNEDLHVSLLELFALITMPENYTHEEREAKIERARQTLQKMKPPERKDDADDAHE
jgi:hypothetical protein